MESATYRPTKVLVTQDWDNDGFLRITGAETLKLYNELRDQQYKIPVTEYGIFFAFSKEQFDDGYKGLVKRGLIKDGDKIKHFKCGAFGTIEGMMRWMKEANAIEERIRNDCDPYEVYLEEYNNHECCIDLDGDQRAVEAVLRLYGLDRTKQAIYGSRFRKCGEIDAIWERMEK